MTKVCKNCKTEKPSTDFSRSKYYKDGLFYLCKDCDYARRGRKQRFKVPTLAWTEPEAAYIAGLADGEGYLGMYKHHEAGRVGTPKMAIYNTSPYFKEFAGSMSLGKVYERDNGKLAKKPIFHWVFSTNEMRAALPRLLRYLTIKRRQAELLLEYLELAANRRTRDEIYRGVVYSIYDELRLLNARGNTEPTKQPIVSCLTTSKMCFSCKQNKPDEDFSRSAYYADGLFYACKQCELIRRCRNHRKQPILAWSESNAAYIAGLTDGEGCLGLYKCANRKHLFAGTMSIFNTSRHFLSFAASSNIGRISMVRKSARRFRACHSWSFNTEEMQVVLPRLLPYLRVKKVQAQLLLDYYSMDTRARTQNETCRAKVYEIAHRLSLLNGRKAIRGTEASAS